MITRVTIRNFKRIREADIDLLDHIVFVGPNNSGKTTAIQALAVWRLALARWLEKREKSKSKATLRTGVSITRSDLMVLPLRDMRSLWHNCDVMDSESRKVRIDKTDAVLQEGSLNEMMWRRREIENYLLVPAAILRFCAQAAKDTFGSSAENGDTPLPIGGTPAVQKLFKKVSRISDEEFDVPLKDSPFLLDTKASEVILEPFFKEFYRMIGQYNVMPKNAFYRIAAVMEKEEIHPEVIEKLDAIAQLS